MVLMSAAWTSGSRLTPFACDSCNLAKRESAEKSGVSSTSDAPILRRWGITSILYFAKTSGDKYSLLSVTIRTLPIRDRLLQLKFYKLLFEPSLWDDECHANLIQHTQRVVFAQIFVRPCSIALS